MFRCQWTGILTVRFPFDTCLRPPTAAASGSLPIIPDWSPLARSLTVRIQQARACAPVHIRPVPVLQDHNGYYEAMQQRACQFNYINPYHLPRRSYPVDTSWIQRVIHLLLLGDPDVWGLFDKVDSSDSSRTKQVNCDETATDTQTQNVHWIRTRVYKYRYVPGAERAGPVWESSAGRTSTPSIHCSDLNPAVFILPSPDYFASTWWRQYAGSLK